MLGLIGLGVGVEGELGRERRQRENGIESFVTIFGDFPKLKGFIGFYRGYTGIMEKKMETTI